MNLKRIFNIDVIARVSIGTILLTTGAAFGAIGDSLTQEIPEPVKIIQVQKETTVEYVKIPEYRTVEVIKRVPQERVPETSLTDEEKELIARVVCAEAGTEDFIGKRLVVDTVLNRVDKMGFGDTVTAVVNGEGQYYMAAGYTEECMGAVEAECYERLDYDIVWFCNNGWMPYGRPAFQHGGHWFNYYNNGENVNLEDVKMGGAGYDR